MSKAFENCEALDIPTAMKLRDLQHDRSFAKRTIIQSEGEPAKTIGIVTSGLAAVVKHTEDGKRQIVGFLTKAIFSAFRPTTSTSRPSRRLPRLKPACFPRPSSRPSSPGTRNWGRIS
jgi:CRP-like cAMP-binding protein